MVLSVLLTLLGVALFITSNPIPGTTPMQTHMLGVLLAGIGGAIWKIMKIESDEVFREKVRQDMRKKNRRR